MIERTIGTTIPHPCWLFVILFCACHIIVDINTVTALTAPLPKATTTTGQLQIDTPYKFVVLGGTGKIGTAVAAHLSHRLSSSSSTSSSSVIEQCEIILVGRRRPEEGKNGNENKYFQAALQEIEDLLSLWEDDNEGSNNGSPKITYQYFSCVIHTAGPYSERLPTVLDACIDHKIPVYVDVSDPVEFLESSLERHQSAIESGTTAILAAGAFPGMSNVLAMEAAVAATATATTTATAKQAVVKDVRFNYFTKGLGGSGTVNLYITNLGFGDDMVMFEKGIRTRFDDLSGRLLGKVDFFINNEDDDDDDNNDNDNNSSWNKDDNDKAKTRVGTQKVFAWPFPEAVTVGKELSITGSSSSAMGTAPEIWNDMLGLLVDLIPRNWWRSRKFSKFLADFSEPLVLATDFAMRKLSSSSSSSSGEGDCGETHAMRIDVITEAEMTSIVQCHDSFRICVGQSCAEFALDALLENPSTSTMAATDTTASSTCTTGGVYLPEQRYRNDKDRSRIVSKLTNTPGTFAYVGPVTIKARPVSANNAEVTRREEVDRIVLKQTPTPGLICNGSPIEIMIERKEPVERQGATDAADGDDRRPTTLPVYPTDVREIVEATQNRIR
ncbi:hypothetical protein FRACYDRAFT_193381 [Fragilariopsis cylindrus CCMP1102]|uniref:Saccharopine dehydrogenase NADP binding domain-containing protein n=1 Tax=Fragilariopsis cylindrus CCMP1102 TaxID=635003 RepID=A0A1E7EXK5_9STRA|nr:hypothetical protein FRACYDRAFT_193381 [Fragilariopsis cylindrus CCMP1102]|eukprot:OEU10768.1 hypothetical protein FRACYDRAFT_193381 [Fragilariopsis cylindrus CCMP1102]